MIYRTLTPTLPKVSAIGLGTWQLGINSGWRSMTEKKAIALVRHALEQGVNFFDTAPNYGLGTSEERLGKALKGFDRSKLVINTKFGHSHTGAFNFRSDAIRSSLEGSLKRLGTDYVDSLILHNPPLEFLDGNKTDHYEVFEKLVEEGKIRVYGASVVTAQELRLLLNTTNSKVVEAFFNILHQEVSSAFDLVQEKQAGVIAKIPLDSGWLSGKYHENSTFEGVRSRWTRQDIKTRARLVEQVKRILQTGDELPQKAIAFCLGYDAVSTVIPGCGSIDQLKQNLRSLEKPLTVEEIHKLEAFYEQEVKALKLPW
ncbi:MAG: aldo/keto reductase [Saprospiraceae bacterium]